MPQLLSTVQAIFSPAERGPMYGVIGAIAGLAAVAGPILGGWLVTNDIAGLGWCSIFLINVPIGTVLALAALAFVPNTRSPHSTRIDLAGVLLLTAGVGGIVYGLIEGGQVGWPGWVFAVIGAGIAVPLAPRLGKTIVIAGALITAANPPCTIRAPTRTPASGASAHAADARVNPITPATKTVRRPYRSPSRAPVTSMQANARA